MSNKNLFQKVRDMKLPIGKYVLFGSAPLGIRGLKDCHDIDIVVTEDLWSKYKSNNWKVQLMPHGSEYLLKDDIELWKDWKPGEWNIDKLIIDAEIIDGLPFVKLEYVVEWKRNNNRDKDLKDIKIIEEFIKKNQ